MCAQRATPAVIASEVPCCDAELRARVVCRRLPKVFVSES